MKDQITLAKEIATKAHEWQFRWDGKTPYIAHPAAIVNTLSRTLPDFNPTYPPHSTIIATAWLHDVVEDTSVTLADLRLAGVSEAVISAVDAITKRDGEEYLNYLLRVRQNGFAVIVKFEDIRNNMSDLDKKKKKSMYEKYQLALYVLKN